jgi:hypothetical protein
MSKSYYCLIAGLPELTIDDSKLSYSVASFKEELWENLSRADRRLIELFYLKFDNANVLKLMDNAEATELDSRGNYSPEELNEMIATIKDGGEVGTTEFPAYLSTFVRECFEGEAQTDSTYRENRLATLYFDYGMKADNRFVGKWFEFNRNVNNILVALTARRYKWDVAQSIVGESEICDALRSSGARDFGLSGEIDYLDEVIKISETHDLVEREKRTDTLRWEWMEEQTFFDYFTVERLFVFLAQLEMVERWIMLDKERGNRMFRSMIDSLKNEVQIPAEFR